MSARVGHSRLKEFLDLSIALTGDAGLPPSLAVPYLKRADHAHPGLVDELLSEFRAGVEAGVEPERTVRDRIVTDEGRWAIARDIISMWMTSRLPSVDAVAPETVPSEQYFQGRLWTAIGAHPLGLSGGYFGHWHYEPES